MNPVLDDKALEYADQALREKEWEPISEKNKILLALGMGAVPPATHAALGMRMGIGILPKSLIMGALGYAIPTIINQAMEKGVDERKEFMRQQFDKAMENPFQKRADLVQALPTVGKIFGKGLKYSLQGGRDFLRGIAMPIKGKNISETALSLGSKAIAGYGLYQTGKFLAQKHRKPNYVDYLRNQVVAGNIKPEELSQRDLSAVQQLGMK
jgi:hypothetical protein